MHHELARLVSRRAQRSIYLLDGLRQALEALDRPEYVAVLDLVREDAAAAHLASERLLDAEATGRHLRTLVDLQQLARLGGPRGITLARRVARRMAS